MKKKFAFQVEEPLVNFSKKHTSRREFLKICSVGTLALAAGLSRPILSFKSSAPPATLTPKEMPPTPADGSEPLIIVVNKGVMVGYQGLSEFTVEDHQLAADLSAQLKSRVG